MNALHRILPPLAALWFAGCGERAATRADLILINGAEIGTIDPARYSFQTESRVISALFEGLMRYDAAGRAEPGCALAPDASADKLTWTFTIRDTARWSDGSPVTAADFARSWQRLLEPATAAEYASIFSCIKGAADFTAGKLDDFGKVGIGAAGERNLVITLTTPVPYFLDLMAMVPFSPVHMSTQRDEDDDQWKPGRLISNGPYVLKEWRLNDRIRLVKNPHYWDAANVKMATVDVQPSDNASTAMNLFLTGQADVMMDKGLIPSSMADRLRREPYFHHKPFLGTWVIRFNVLRKPYDDHRVRKALTMVIDRRRMTDVVTRLGEEPATTMSPPGIGNGYELPAGLLQNIPEAKRLLADAGYPDGHGFPVMDFLYPSGYPSDNGIAVELQAMWKSYLGIIVHLQREDLSAYKESQRNLQYDVSRSSWIGDYNDPNTFLDVFTSTNGNNNTGWKSAEYDRLIDAAAAELDPAKRCRMLREAEFLLVNTACVVAPVYHYVGVQFYFPDKLGGIEANVIDEHPIRTMFWKTKPAESRLVRE